MDPTLDDLHWLVSDQAQSWIQEAPIKPEARDVDRLRKALGEARTHLVLTLAQDRRRARHKFPRADSMFFTRRSLEQSTDESLAFYKGARFRTVTPQPIIDLCCGIGGDLIGLGREGPVRGLDRAPHLVLFARANAAVYELPDCEVQEAELTESPPSFDGAWHIDPDRRPAERRTTRLEVFEPGFDFLESWRHPNPNGAIKLAPASRVPDRWGDVAERQWVSTRGECRQQILWLGNLARHPGRNVATRVGEGGIVHGEVVDQGEPAAPIATDARTFLYDPDPSVLASGVLDALAFQHGLFLLNEGVPYLTSDHGIDHPLLSTFRVLESSTVSPKRLRAMLRAHSISSVDIKRRGLPFDIEPLRKSLGVKGGSREDALLIARDATGTRAYLTKRLETLE